jgi:hypothetical protein
LYAWGRLYAFLMQFVYLSKKRKELFYYFSLFVITFEMKLEARQNSCCIG